MPRSPSSPQQELTGIYRAAGGFGFVAPEEGGEDCFIPPRKEGPAWDGDRVAALVREEPGEDGRTRRVGRICRVLERRNTVLTGILRQMDRSLWLLPDRDKLPGPIKLPGRWDPDLPGCRAAVRVESYGGHGASPVGRLLAVFGPADRLSSAVDAILYENGISRDFPPDVLEQLPSVPGQVQETELAGRLDLRGELLFTIDGADAMDLDDAVSLSRDGEGRWVLGVHIADVSHYVPADSPLDREAWLRGTSVYFPGQVVPMLPPALSNGICSLHPGVDRLTCSCIMTLDGEGTVTHYRICKSVIRSEARMTYEECNAMLSDGPDALPLRQRCPRLFPVLREMAALSALLERRRRLRGALDLESGDTAVLCDEAGHPVRVERCPQGTAQRLIESFMLLANETVAGHLTALGGPCLYRVHEKPSQEKMDQLRTVLEPFGYSLPTADHFTLQRILRQAEEKGEGALVSSLLLRAMMKARYDVENIGHFGLAAPCYCHFTSPIRRYPDLMVHRLLSLLPEGGAEASGAESVPRREALSALCARAAVQSSQRELAAQTAQREILRRYLAAYMADHIGETFSAQVSGVGRWGLFVSLPSGVEGFLGVDALPGRRWHFDPRRLTLREEGGGLYTYGAALEVLCLRADPLSGLIDFGLPGEPLSPTPPPEKAPRAAGKRPASRQKPRFDPPRRRSAGRRGRKKN